jgi:hypothetical protein
MGTSNLPVAALANAASGEKPKSVHTEWTDGTVQLRRSGELEIKLKR